MAPLPGISWRMQPQALALRAGPTQQPRASRFVSCGIPALDRALHGGLPVGTITEIVGPSGAGKTQFCLGVAAHALLAPDGIDGRVLYIDTEGAFSAVRFLEVRVSTATPGLVAHAGAQILKASWIAINKRPLTGDGSEFYPLLRDRMVILRVSDALALLHHLQVRLVQLASGCFDMLSQRMPRRCSSRST
jgi:RecA/RadA recombinase